VQDVFNFLMVQDLPPAVTLLPVIAEPPFELGREIVTVTFTFPFLGADDVTVTTVGAEGLVILAFESKAWEGLTARADSIEMAAKKVVALRINTSSVA
jgi:hypothetical protein